MDELSHDQGNTNVIFSKAEKRTISVADLESLSRIPSPIQKDSGVRIRNNEFKYFNPKNCFYALGNMIRDVHPGS
jgi:hypothetical protein